MTLRFLPIILLTGLLISDELNAMQRENPNVVKVQCDIHKDEARLSFITFSTAFVKYQSGKRNFHNTIALQCMVTQTPTVTVDASDKSMTLQCTFKDVTMQQHITVNENIPLISGTAIRPLSHGWRMTITTTTLPIGDPDR